MQIKAKNQINYKKLSDRELVDVIVNGDEKAVEFLIYNKYDRLIRYWVNKVFKSKEYLNDMRIELFMKLYGKDHDWKPLKSLEGQSLFAWLNTVCMRLFLSKRDKMIGSGITKTSNNNVEVNRLGDEVAPDTSLIYTQDERKEMVMMLEAINLLKNEDYRFIILKELDGYNHEEIAVMLAEKDKRDKKVRKNNKGEVSTPNAAYIDMLKGRAKKEIKRIIGLIKKEYD